MKEPKQSGERKKQQQPPLHERILKTLANNKRLYIWIAIYVIVNTGLFLTSLRYLHTNVWVVIARACGMSLNFNCVLILITMLRSTLTWLRSTGVGWLFPIDEHVQVHRFVGYTIVALSTLHAFAHCANLGKFLLLLPKTRKTQPSRYFQT